MSIDDQIKQRAREYAASRELQIVEEIGSGNDGVVYSTDRVSAIKALKYQKLYQNERNVYQRLASFNIDTVEGFSVPRLIDCDDNLWTVEMEIVTRPFVLDFAGAYLDEEPPYFHDEEIMGEWLKDRQDRFGDRWETVATILACFRRYGIYLADVKYDNIEFASDDTGA